MSKDRNKLKDNKSLIFELPSDCIASCPSESCRLMLLEKSSGNIIESNMEEFSSILESDDVMVLNENKTGNREFEVKDGTGNVYGKVTLITRIAPYMWNTLINDNSYLSVGSRVYFNDDIFATVIDKSTTRSVVLSFNNKKSEKSLMYCLDKIGKISCLNYLDKDCVNTNTANTCYYNKSGDVISQSCGLNSAGFSLNKNLLKRIYASKAYINLNIGIGSYREIDVLNHDSLIFDSEYYELGKQAAATINAASGRVVCVGTSSMRAVESSVGAGNKCRENKGNTSLFLSSITKATLTQGLLTKFNIPGSASMIATTALCDASMIVEAYKKGIERGYKFLEFGDSLLII